MILFSIHYHQKTPLRGKDQIRNVAFPDILLNGHRVASITGGECLVVRKQRNKVILRIICMQEFWVSLAVQGPG